MELTASYQWQTVVQRADFRSALMMQGSVMEANGQAIPQVEVLLSDLDEAKIISTSQTANNGSFAIEFPSDGSFLMTENKDTVSLR